MPSIVVRLRVAAVAASLAAVACAGTGGVAVAADAPAPGVARIGDVAGRVDVRRGDDATTLAAVANAPLGAGDYLTTGPDARAELEFDYGALVRVAAATQLRLTHVEAAAHVLQLADGSAELRTTDAATGRPEIDTPGVAVVPRENGRYLVTVLADGSTQVTVRAGAADVTPTGGTEAARIVEPGSTLVATGSGASVTFATVAAVPAGDLDRYAESRDALWDVAHAAPYVRQGLVGANDLDRYGHWTDDATYGRVWVPPAQPAGWTPYSDGRWTWQPYYGWTWVGYEPWGWAPYHYGRWFYAAGGPGWCWYPGAYGGTYAYAPAQVGFLSFGSGFGIDLTFGNVAWVPLAPFEAYRPWYGPYGYGYGYGYGSHVTVVQNVTNVTNITNVTNVSQMPAGYATTYKSYRNTDAPNAVVGVRGADFAQGRFDRVRPLRPSELAGTKPVIGLLPLVPTARNLELAPAHRTEPPLALSPHFRSLPALRALPTFAQQRAEVAAAAHRAYPQFSQRTTLAPASATDASRVVTPASAAWNRFDPSAAARLTPQAQRGFAIRANATDPRATHGVVRTGAAASVADPWSRFGAGATAAHPLAAPRQTLPAYATSRTVAPASATHAAPGYAPRVRVSPTEPVAPRAVAPRAVAPRIVEPSARGEEAPRRSVAPQASRAFAPGAFAHR